MHDQPAYERLYVNASWLIKLRWVAVVGQLMTIAIVFYVLRVDIRVAPLLSLVLVTAVSNALLSRWLIAVRHQSGRRSLQFSSCRNLTASPSLDDTPSRRESHIDGAPRWKASRLLVATLGGVMLLDLLNLTALLYFTGGPTNPFVLFYLVNLGLAAIVLPARWAWLLHGFAIVCMALLFFDHVAVPQLYTIDGVRGFRWIGQLSLPAQGLFVAFVTCSSVVVYFTTRLTSELRRRESELFQAEMLRARSEKIEALGTLAAGAAHELATPLSTIAVVSKEVERDLEGQGVPASVIEDMKAIRNELDRCRTILDRMSIESGQAIGEPLTPVTGSELLGAVTASFQRNPTVRSSCSDLAAEKRVSVPLQGLAQAIRGIVQNAVDVTADGGSVRVSVDTQNAQMLISVQDDGQGMTPEVLHRAGEPFFTTKEPGRGMGMGLFLARSVIERLDGTIDIQSTAGAGTTVRITLPLSQPTQGTRRE